MARVFVGIGSNIEPEDNIRQALLALAARVRIVAVSTFYHTIPEERPEQPIFVNGVIEIETALSPGGLKVVLRSIEYELGRERTEDKYAARTIDLDILLYDNLRVKTNGLTIPDPDISRRPFLAIPLCELDASIMLPDSGFSIRDAAKSLSVENMEAMVQFSDTIRREVVYEQ